MKATIYNSGWGCKIPYVVAKYCPCLCYFCPLSNGLWQKTFTTMGNYYGVHGNGEVLRVSHLVSHCEMYMRGTFVWNSGPDGNLFLNCQKKKKNWVEILLTRMEVMHAVLVKWCFPNRWRLKSYLILLSHGVLCLSSQHEQLLLNVY